MTEIVEGTAKIEFVKTIEYPDGTADYVFTFNKDAMIALAKIGLTMAIEAAAEAAIEAAGNGHNDPEGADNPSAGEDGDPPVHGEVPAL